MRNHMWVIILIAMSELLLFAGICCYICILFLRKRQYFVCDAT